jgi:hypothetical protein
MESRNTTLRFGPHGQPPAVEAEPTTVFLIAGAIRSAFPPSLDERDKLEWALGRCVSE